MKSIRGYYGGKYWGYQVHLAGEDGRPLCGDHAWRMKLYAEYIEFQLKPTCLKCLNLSAKIFLESLEKSAP